MVNKFDKDWTDFVLNELEVDETPDGHPTCQGLMRVCEKVYGKIINIDAEVLKNPSEGDPSATVKATIQCLEYVKDDKGDINRSNIDEGILLTYSALADSHREYLPQQYAQHLVSSIETRALGRAIKKLLNLKIHTSEEMESNNYYREGIQSSQKEVIIKMCKDLELDLPKFLAKDFSLKEEQLSKTSSEIAKKIIERLNFYKNNSKETPKEIKK